VGEAVLRLEGVRKSYEAAEALRTEVLHGIDLTLAPGEFAALIGPSGSGKSTLLNLVGLLDRPSAGRVIVAGEDTAALDESGLTRLRGRSIGFVFQYHHLISAFSALENVMMPALIARGRPDDEMRDNAARLLESVGLARWSDQPVNRLSGGQQQRVAVARALAMRAPLVLADEPTGNLDTKSADGVFEVMRAVNIANGTAFLIVTHDPRLAARCDRVIELVDGAIVADAARGPGFSPGARRPGDGRESASTRS
jgi:lipoprotein-releasing system ATP-binding protein